MKTVKAEYLKAYWFRYRTLSGMSKKALAFKIVNEDIPILGRISYYKTKEELVKAILDVEFDETCREEFGEHHMNIVTPLFP